ncbi:MAG: 2-oxo acid dehydrogenase subunit E2, partial [Myxococcota bacterium]
KKNNSLLHILPTWLIRPLVNVIGYLTSAVGVEFKPLGLERFPFGSCIITSVGMFGLDEGWAPPTPFARVPLYVLVGAVREHPAVVDGELVVRPQMTISATVDHRFVDGFQVGVMTKVIKRTLENPWLLEEESGEGKGGHDHRQEALEAGANKLLDTASTTDT